MLTHIENIESVPDTVNEVVREVWQGEHSSVAYVTVQPKRTTRPHYHNGFTELYLIVYGEGDVVVDDRTFHVWERDFVEIKPGAIHHIINTEDCPLELAVFSEPPYDRKDVIYVDPES